MSKSMTGKDLTAVIDPLGAVHPELRPAAQNMQAITAAMSSIAEMDLAAVRAASPFEQVPLADVPFAAKRIPGPAGAPDVVVYVVNSKPGAPRPVVVHAHSGGFVIGSAKSSVPNLQVIAKTLDCTCVSVEYRLAPEARYSESVEDNYAALRWTYENAAELNIDPTRIALLGESAGGGHAVLLAIAARDRGEVPVAFQCLVYPMLDDRTGTTRQAPPHIGNVVWPASANRFGWRSFLGMEPGGDNVPTSAVPARVKSVAGLPPAFICVGAIDLFVDESIQYARRLIDAGVPTELLVVPGAFHGFQIAAPDASVSRQFTQAKLQALARAFGIN